MSSDLLRPLYGLVRVQLDALEVELDQGDEVLGAIELVAQGGDVGCRGSRRPAQLLYEGGLANAFGTNDCDVDGFHIVFGMLKLGAVCGQSVKSAVCPCPPPVFGRLELGPLYLVGTG